MRFIKLLKMTVLCLFFNYSYSVSAQNNDYLPAQELVNLLQKGGYIVYFRHASTDHSIDDQHPVNLEDCSTQRNLNAEGKEEARIIGENFIRLNIPIGHIYSSPFCRCKDTAKIAFGNYEINDNLYYAIALEPEKRSLQKKYLQTELATIPADNTNTIIFAHTSNLREAAGVWPKPEGAAIIFRPLAQGSFEILGQIQPDEWLEIKK